MKTVFLKEAAMTEQWFLIDAKGKTLGRLATKIATLLMGKHKTTYAPHQYGGDFVVVINAKEVKVTGSKELKKRYHSHTGHPGGYKEVVFKDMRANKPEEIIRLAVKRMLPHNNLGRNVMSRLKIYSGSEHNHQAQKPAVA